MIYYLKLYIENKSGLCNQLYSLAACICYGYTTKKYNKIVVGNFYLDIEKGGVLPFGSIIDVSYLNEYCMQHYEISIEEGTNIAVHTNDFYQVSPIVFFGQVDTPGIFINILKQGIKFKEYIIDCIDESITQHIMKAIDITNPLNICFIHLRLEKDVLQHYKNDNVLLSDVQIKYMDLIRYKCNPNTDFIILLSGDDDNNDVILQYLDIHNYKYYFSKKKCFNKREVNAIGDLILCESITKKYSHKINMHVLGIYESSYSYTLIHRIFGNTQSKETTATICSFLLPGFKSFNLNSQPNEYRSFL